MILTTDLTAVQLALHSANRCQPTAALAFSAGAFICIALSDLLPEVQFHSHDRMKLTVAFLLGIGLAYAIGSVEPEGAHASEHITKESIHG